MANKWIALRKGLRRSMRSLLRQWQERHFRPGQLVASRYRIDRRLGMGSYGVAYLCRDQEAAQGDGSLCVLKRIFPLNGSRQRTITLFKRETELLNRLNHPGIPSLSDHFFHQALPCLVMEYVRGDSLDELLFRDSRPFTELQSLKILEDLLPIVAYLHSEGIVHRDISIGNVMLSEGKVRLIDFGLAVEIGNHTVLPAAVEGADVDPDDPMEKKLMRAPRVSSDFYAIGHLLLFLLYSTYNDENHARGAHQENPRSEWEQGFERSWEQELKLHHLTIDLLRRLLQAEACFTDAKELQLAIRQVITRLEEVM